MWSVGVLLYILICGCPPFEGKNCEEMLSKICKAEFSFNGRGWDCIPEAKGLIYNLLQFDPSERYDTHEAVNHEFFNSALS